MAWIIGIDEAGYGPNLGPFVMSSVAWRVPDALACDGVPDLWKALPKVVCKGAGKDKGRLVVDDSKIVHGRKGLAGLERGVLALLMATTPGTVAELLRDSCREGLADLASEAWYTGGSAVPVHAQPTDLETARATLKTALEKVGIDLGPWACWIAAAPRFNALTDAAGSKAIVLARGLQRLLAEMPDLPGDDPLFLFVDKHGGRNTYAPFLQEAFVQGMVVARQESAARSLYEVIGLARRVVLCFEPRADSAHLTVALASMVAKYLRERLMEEFNVFFQKHVPGLAPTAGYPGDANRFLDAIRPILPALNLSEDRVWRKK
jgi:hypothetical protein